MPKIIYLKLSTHIVPFMKTEMRAEFVWLTMLEPGNVMHELPNKARQLCKND
jgi:hypothetical protein